MKNEAAQNLVPLQPGQLLIWRSDLVHTNQSGLPASRLGPARPDHDRFQNIARLGLFVTVCPKIYRTEAQRRLKIERAAKGFCTTHSPHVVSVLSPPVVRMCDTIDTHFTAPSIENNSVSPTGAKRTTATARRTRATALPSRPLLSPIPIKI